MTTAPNPPKPADEPEDRATKEPERTGGTKSPSKASWFTFRRTMLVGGALSIGWGAGVLVGRRLGWWDEGASGTFGDSFAPLLGLLTVAALAAALDSVRMQREELELTREEMKKQREVTQEQAAEVKRANDLAEKANALAARGQWIAIHQALIANDQGAIHSTREEVRDRAKALQRVLLDVIKDMPRD